MATMTLSPTQRRALIVLTFIAAIIRLFRLPELMVFRADQAIDAQAVLNMVRGDFTLLGPKASVGDFYNGPIVYYLLYPFFLLLGPGVMSGTLMQTLLSVATVPLVYYLGKRIQNDAVGLFAAFLFAISPLHVEYARAIFNSYPAVFFSTLCLCLLITIRDTKQFLTKQLIALSLLLGVFLGMMLQMHYFTAVIMLTALLYPVLHPPLRTRYYLIPLVVGIGTGLSPYILFELTHNFLNIRGILAYAQAGGGVWSPIPFFSLGPTLLAQMVGGNNIWFGTLAFLLVWWTIFTHRRRIGSAQDPAFVVLLVIVLMSGLLFLYGKPLTTHYAISIQVPLLLLVSWGLYELLGQRTDKLLIVAALLFFINLPAYHWFERSNPLQDGITPADFTYAADIIHEDAKPAAYNVGMDAQQDNRAMPLRYVLDTMGDHPLPVESYGQATILYFIVPTHKNDTDVRVWEFESFGAKELVQSWKLNEQYELKKYRHKAQK